MQGAEPDSLPGLPGRRRPCPQPPTALQTLDGGNRRCTALHPDEARRPWPRQPAGRPGGRVPPTRPRGELSFPRPGFQNTLPAFDAPPAPVPCVGIKGWQGIKDAGPLLAVFLSSPFLCDVTSARPLLGGPSTPLEARLHRRGPRRRPGAPSRAAQQDTVQAAAPVGAGNRPLSRPQHTAGPSHAPHSPEAHPAARE